VTSHHLYRLITSKRSGGFFYERRKGYIAKELKQDKELSRKYAPNMPINDFFK